MGFTEEYAAHLTRRNLRPTYINTLRQSLHRLETFLAPTGLLDAITPELVAYLDSRRHQPASRGVEIVHIRAFYRWALDHGMIQTDPTRQIERPRKRRSLPRPMPGCDITLALANPPERVASILYLALYAGLRACEIAQLRAEDISNGIIVVVEGKGGGMSSVPLAPRLEDALHRYGVPSAGWLFPKLNGRPGHVSRQRICYLANDYLHALGISHTLHTLRHRFCTEAYRVSHDLRATQELARHQDPRTTAGYTWTDPSLGVQIVGKLPAFT